MILRPQIPRLLRSSRLFLPSQLNQSLATGRSFAGYVEAPVVFRPTYKYDNGTDYYDTSDKMRIPAYTDRILYKGDSLDCYRYQRAELRTSDHRPVYALFRSRIRQVDVARRNALRKELLRQLMEHAPSESLDAKLTRLALNRTTATGSGLPRPSDDNQAWWNEVDGSFRPPPLPPRRSGSGPVSNPFDPSPPAPSSSTVPSNGSMRVVPALPARASAPSLPPKLSSSNGSAPDAAVGSLIDVSPEDSASSAPSQAALAAPPAFQAVRRKPPPAPPRKPTPSDGPTSLAPEQGTPVRADPLASSDTGESWQILP